MKNNTDHTKEVVTSSRSFLRSKQEWDFSWLIKRETNMQSNWTLESLIGPKTEEEQQPVLDDDVCFSEESSFSIESRDYRRQSGLAPKNPIIEAEALLDSAVSAIEKQTDFKDEDVSIDWDQLDQPQDLQLDNAKEYYNNIQDLEDPNKLAKLLAEHRFLNRHNEKEMEVIERALGDSDVKDDFRDLYLQAYDEIWQQNKQQELKPNPSSQCSLQDLEQKEESEPNISNTKKNSSGSFLKQPLSEEERNKIYTDLKEKSITEAVKDKYKSVYKSIKLPSIGEIDNDDEDLDGNRSVNLSQSPLPEVNHKTQPLDEKSQSDSIESFLRNEELAKQNSNLTNGLSNQQSDYGPEIKPYDIPALEKQLKQISKENDTYKNDLKQITKEKKELKALEFAQGFMKKIKTLENGLTKITAKVESDIERIEIQSKKVKRDKTTDYENDKNQKAFHRIVEGHHNKHISQLKVRLKAAPVTDTYYNIPQKDYTEELAYLIQSSQSALEAIHQYDIKDFKTSDRFIDPIKKITPKSFREYTSNPNNPAKYTLKSNNIAGINGLLKKINIITQIEQQKIEKIISENDISSQNIQEIQEKFDKINTKKEILKSGIEESNQTIKELKAKLAEAKNSLHQPLSPKGQGQSIDHLNSIGLADDKSVLSSPFLSPQKEVKQEFIRHSDQVEDLDLFSNESCYPLQDQEAEQEFTPHSDRAEDPELLDYLPPRKEVEQKPIHHLNSSDTEESNLFKLSPSKEEDNQPDQNSSSNNTSNLIHHFTNQPPLQKSNLLDQSNGTHSPDPQLTNHPEGIETTPMDYPASRNSTVDHTDKNNPYLSTRSQTQQQTQISQDFDQSDEDSQTVLSDNDLIIGKPPILYPKQQIRNSFVSNKNISQPQSMRQIESHSDSIKPDSGNPSLFKPGLFTSGLGKDFSISPESTQLVRYSPEPNRTRAPTDFFALSSTGDLPKLLFRRRLSFDESSLSPQQSYHGSFFGRGLSNSSLTNKLQLDTPKSIYIPPIPPASLQSVISSKNPDKKSTIHQSTISTRPKLATTITQSFTYGSKTKAQGTQTKNPKIIQEEFEVSELDKTKMKLFIQTQTTEFKKVPKYLQEYQDYQDQKNNHTFMHAIAESKYKILYSAIGVGGYASLGMIIHIPLAASPIGMATHLILVSISALIAHEAGSYADKEAKETKERELEAGFATARRIIDGSQSTGKWLKKMSDENNHSYNFYHKTFVNVEKTLPR